MKPLAFISHSSKDKPVALGLAADLRRLRVAVWIDSERIKYGQCIAQAIQDGLAQADCILVLVSQSFVASRWCRAEYEPLLMAEIDSGDVLVVPVLIDNCEMPLLLKRKSYCDLRVNERDFDTYERRRKNVAELAQHIRANHRDRKKQQDSLSEFTSASRSPTRRLQLALQSLDADSLLRQTAQQTNREAAVNLLEEVTTLIERFEAQYDELIAILIDYESAHRVSRSRLMQANRKLLTFSNEMRSIFHGVGKRFVLSPAVKETIDSITNTCLQIAAIENILVILGIENSDGVNFDLEKQRRMLDGFRDFEKVMEWGDSSSGDGGSMLVDNYHHILIQLNDYKIALKEAVFDLESGE
jgi:hypothetical protein